MKCVNICLKTLQEFNISPLFFLSRLFVEFNLNPQAAFGLLPKTRCSSNSPVSGEDELPVTPDLWARAEPCTFSLGLPIPWHQPSPCVSCWGSTRAAARFSSCLPWEGAKRHSFCSKGAQGSYPQPLTRVRQASRGTRFALSLNPGN